MAIMNQEQRPGLVLERAVLAVPAVNGVLRDAAGVHLAKWGLEDLADDALLVVSELVTNAITASPGGPLWFRMMRWPRMLAIEVRDCSAERVQRREPGMLDESGRGLWMVEQVARHWGQRWEVDGTKTVYALLDLPNPGNSENHPE
jgi:signal transduction histidine kinase